MPFKLGLGRARLPGFSISIRNALPWRSRSTLSLVLILGILSAGCGRKARVPPPVQTSPAATTRPVPAKRELARTTSSTGPSPSARIPGPAPPAPGAGGPIIRIGLTTTAREIRISGEGGSFSFQEKAPEARRTALVAEATVRIERASRGDEEVFRLQVAALSRRESAERLLARLRDEFSQPISIHETNNHLYQVRLGAFLSREEALSYASSVLASAGYKDCIVVRETGSQMGGESIVALRSGDSFNINRSGFLFFPGSPGQFLRVDGKPFRGMLDVQINRGGRLTLVNHVQLEDYLFGVVPAEISPTVYPEFAALAAQAIAARTYALKNMGRFGAEGFDLTADVRSQVYGGVAQEREATNDAVLKTAGIGIFYQDSLIDAMYMSTCGGRTEDFAAVFESAAVPYLQSVPCTSEDAGAGSTKVQITGHTPLMENITAEDGTSANRNLELARLLALEDTPDWSTRELSRAATGREVKRWLERARGLIGQAPVIGMQATDEPLSRAEAHDAVVESLIGLESVARSVTPADAEYYLGNLKDGREVPTSRRSALAYLLHSRLWSPFPDNSARPAEAIARVHCLHLIVRLLERAKPEMLRSGTLDGGIAGENSGERASGLKVRGGNQSRTIPISEQLSLFRLQGEQSTPAVSLSLIGNERLRFHLDPAGRIDFLEVELNASGAASDRFSPQALWHATLSRQTLEEKLRPLAADIGEIQDLRPSRLGKSGRATQVEIVGSRRSMLLNGYKARNALGLKDTLFVIQRSFGPAGLVETFTFDGRGWGHGVGLCQVGAYGMARAGKSYEEILKSYYTGVELRRAY